jgi:hypothetical protein
MLVLEAGKTVQYGPVAEVLKALMARNAVPGAHGTQGAQVVAMARGHGSAATAEKLS